jgi:hypothetical protein
MVRLFLFLFFIDLTVLIVALIDCLSTDNHEIRNFPRIAWILLILLLSPVGAIGWFLAGRPRRMQAHPQAWHPAGSGQPRRPLAPDDDPQFLRELSARARTQDEDRLRRWEDDLRRREKERRQPDSPGDPDNPDGPPLSEV